MSDSDTTKAVAGAHHFSLIDSIKAELAEIESGLQTFFGYAGAAAPALAAAADVAAVATGHPEVIPMIQEGETAIEAANAAAHAKNVMAALTHAQTAVSNVKALVNGGPVATAQTAAAPVAVTSDVTTTAESTDSKATS